VSRTENRSAPFILITFCAALATGCAARLASLPTGPGTPAPADYPAAYEQATEHCRGVRTMRASLNVSGRAGDTRLRGRIDAGLAEPGLVRLEGSSPIPFGRPVFILVGRPTDATLVLPRDKRVLTDATAEAIIEALTGVPLTPDELRAVLSGCGLLTAMPAQGRAYGKDWIAVELANVTSWLRNTNGRWRTVATSRGPLEIRYEAFTATHPSRIRLRTTASSSARADITLRVSDVDTNVPLDPAVFRVEVPDDAVPMKIEELRRAIPQATRSPQPADRGPRTADRELRTANREL
jgi:hypothetical protein